MKRAGAWLAAGLLACPAAQAVTCTVTSTGVNFATYDPTVNTATDTVGTVTVNCSGLLGLFVSYAIQLSAGNSGNQLSRYMTSGASQLQYNLYTDIAHTTVWGDGSGGSSSVSGNFVLVIGGSIAPYSVYGHMPARQIAAAGNYADNLTLTLTY